MEAPSRALKLWTLEAPQLEVPMKNLINGASGTVTIPCPSYLVQHERGLVLFDTSITPLAVDDPVAVYGEALASLNLFYPPEFKIDNQLRALGFSLEDVGHVVTSHGHFDHCGGIGLFPDAKHYVGENEINYAFWPSPPGVEFFSGAPFEPIRGKDILYVPLHVDHDVFGDGSVVVLSMPGHTIGNLALLVRLGSGQNVILTGDTVHLRHSMADLLPGPYDYSSRQAIDSIRRLGRLRQSLSAALLITHDLDDYAEFGHAPAFME
jgi:N-acyl homoserine lactone hydrolase